MANPWFRLYHEFSTNPKVQMLSEVNQRRYLMVLCARCRNGDKSLQDENAAFEMRISKEEWIKTKKVLGEVNLIDDLNKPIGWDERQYVSDSSTARSAKHRMKKKQQHNVSATAPDTDTDTDTETDTEAEAEEKINDTLPFTKKKEPVPYKKIIELYHECLPELPAVMKLTQKRKTQIRQRFNEDLDGLINWKNYFDYVGQSDFLMGRVQPSNGRAAFVADLEWITHSGHFVKITEGKYHLREA